MTAPNRKTEPAAAAEAVRAVLVALVALGWATIPDATINTITSTVGVLVSIGLTWWTRNRVTPAPKPTE